MKEIKLVCFDMDGTLILGNTWYTLNVALGISKEIDEEMLRQYWAGELPYLEWNKKLVDWYKKSGLASEENIKKIISNPEFREGAKEVIEYLKNKGYKTAIVSGSIDTAVGYVAGVLGVDHWKSGNKVIYGSDGMLESIESVDDEHVTKLANFKELCQEINVSPEEAVFVGNDLTDVPVFELTGRGIGIAGTKAEEKAWKVIENLSDLKNIL